MKDVLSIIEHMENIIEEASGVFFSDKVMVDQDELLDLIKDIRIALPEELKKASYINENRDRILAQAQEEADLIVEEAENKIQDLVDEDGITREANFRAEEIITRAQENAKEIRLGSLEYADSILINIEDGLMEIIETIKENRDELKED